MRHVTTTNVKLGYTQLRRHFQYTVHVTLKLDLFLFCRHECELFVLTGHRWGKLRCCFNLTLTQVECISGGFLQSLFEVSLF